MAEEVGKGVVSIEADTKGLGADIARKVDGERGVIGKTFSGLGSAMGKAFKAAAVAGAAGVIAAAAFGKASIDAASDLSESMSKVDVVFGDASDSVVAWSKTSAEAFGQSQQQALEAAGTYGNLFQAFGIGQKPAQEMSQSLVQLAADLASFNNTSVDDAILALRSGLSGETEPLKRYGVAINDARLKQEALAMGLIKSTKEALTPAAKAQAAYALVMKDTTLAQGDFARTSDGLANKQRILSAKFQDLKANIGTALLPVMLTVVAFLTDKFIPAIGKIGTAFSLVLGDDGAYGFAEVMDNVFGNTGKTIPMFERVGNAIRGIVGFFREVVQWVRRNWPTIRNVTVTVMKAVVVAVQAAFRAVVIAVRATVDFMRTRVIPAFKAIVDFVADHWDTIAAVATAVGKAIAKAFMWIIDHKEYLIAALAGIVAGIIAWSVAAAALVPEMAAVAATTGVALGPVLAIGAAIAALVAGLIYAYKHWGWFRAAVDGVAEFLINDLVPILRTVWDVFVKVVEIAIRPLIVQFKAAKAVITEVVIPAFRAMWSFINDKVIPVVMAIATAIAAVASAVSEKVTAIVGFITGIAGRIFAAASTMFNAVRTAISVVTDFVSGKVDTIVGFITGIAARIFAPAAAMFNAVKTAIAGLVTAVANSVGRIVGFFVELPGRIRDVFADAATWLYDAGTRIVKGLYDGIVKAPYNIASAIASKVPGFGGIGKNDLEPYLDDLKHKATGGVTQGWTVVGERGPEIAHFSRPTTIVPNNRVEAWLSDHVQSGGQMFGGATYNFTLVGAGPESGRQIIETIKAHERLNGPGWRTAA